MADINKKHHWVYVLELNDGKYYVGLTTQFNAAGRIAQHQSGYFSAKWVKLYGYKRTLQIHDLGLITEEEAEKAENILTRDLMQEHGRDNVRGGDLSYSGKYLYRFGRFHRDENWEIVVGVSFMMLVIAVLSAAYLYERYFA